MGKRRISCKSDTHTHTHTYKHLFKFRIMWHQIVGYHGRCFSLSRAAVITRGGPRLVREGVSFSLLACLFCEVIYRSHGERVRRPTPINRHWTRSQDIKLEQSDLLGHVRTSPNLFTTPKTKRKKVNGLSFGIEFETSCALRTCD